MTVRKRATVEPELSASQLPLPPQAPSRTPGPNGSVPDGDSDASEAAINVPALDSTISWPEPESTISWPEPEQAADASPSFERETPRSTHPIDVTSGPVGGTDQSHAATPKKVATEGPSPVIVITLALLALFGPTYHTVQWLRRRKARDRWNTERASRSEEIGTDTNRRLSTDSREQITETLQQLLNEMQTKLHAPPGAVRSIAERELDQNQISATKRTPKIGLPASSH